MVDTNAFRLTPLIYSDGPVPSDTSHGINTGGTFSPAIAGGDVFGPSNISDFLKIGSLLPVNATSYGGITNHQVDMR